jgi:hypothetical protein
MIDSTLITLIASIAGIILAALLVALVKVVTTFVNRNMSESFNISKGFVRKSELTEFKNEMKRDMAIERVALQELLLQQLDKSIDNKIKEFRNVGNKLITIDQTINTLELLKEDFKEKVASFNLVDDQLLSLRKEVNQIKYGTDAPSAETIERRRG